ncbi:HNH endonuclease signature motif containing protein [Hathewaya massiliensis]|uniref:HNH endonuclease signature motif containing protein n=1 Tax=Hathewaya massiliensis TaxID=1964382 RepID=UPI001FAAFA16|nr:HNH endonuclease signature motif containing protein [Hathewaya massiliensis]
MARKYTEEHLDYLRQITPGRYTDEITELFNEKFKMNVTRDAIRSLMVKHKIKSTVSKQKIQFKKEHLEYLRQLCDEGLFNDEITRKFNETFNQNRTESSIQNIRTKYNIKTSARKVWENGHTPWNKGLKGIVTGGVETQFKKGEKPPNWVPLGTERISKDGYIEVKIQDGKLNKNWRGKHIVIWEKHNGPLPKNHAIIFGDGNKRNFDINNLILVSRRQLLILNKNKLIQNDADLTRTGVIIADIYQKINEKSKV